MVLIVCFSRALSWYLIVCFQWGTQLTQNNVFQNGTGKVIFFKHSIVRNSQANIKKEET